MRGLEQARQPQQPLIQRCVCHGAGIETNDRHRADGAGFEHQNAIYIMPYAILAPPHRTRPKRYLWGEGGLGTKEDWNWFYCQYPHV